MGGRREAFQELRVLRGHGAVDAQAGIRPLADPVAVVEIGVAGVAVADEGLVMAAARAERPGPARLALVLRAESLFEVEFSPSQILDLFQSVLVADLAQAIKAAISSCDNSTMRDVATTAVDKIDTPYPARR